MSRHNKRRVLALDLDDVLVECFGPLAQWHNRHYDTAVEFEHFLTYDFWEVLGCSLEIGRERCYEFFQSDSAQEVNLVPGALEAIYALAEQYTLIGVTGRPIEVARPTERLLARHFSGVIQQVEYTNAFHGTMRQTKLEVCHRYSAICLIDDHAAYAKLFAGNPDSFLLFGNYPWNRNVTQLTRVDWSQICARFLGK